MAGTGPTPNPNSRRQSSGSRAQTWLDLPADGYAGEIPEWPFATASDAELAMWNRYWRKPQAAAWARMCLVDEVAIYVRAFLTGSEVNVKAMTEARQQGDLLGLNPRAMLRNRWRIRSDEVSEQRQSKSSGSKARGRLKVADGAVAQA